MWQLFNYRKWWVDNELATICEANGCEKEDFGSANPTSDYDLSIKKNKENKLPEGLKANRPKVGQPKTAPAADVPAAGGDTPPEMKQVEAAITAASSITPRDKVDVPQEGKKEGGVSTVIAKFGERVINVFGTNPGLVFDTNLYDAGDTVPAALNEGPALQMKAAKDADALVQDVAAMTKVRRYLADKDETPPTYRSKTYDLYRDSLIRRVQDPNLKERLGAVLEEAHTTYVFYRSEFDEQLKQIQKDDASKGFVGKSQDNGDKQADLDPTLIKEDQKMRAANKLYAERVAVVDALRVQRDDLIANINTERHGIPDADDKARIDALTNQIRGQSVIALQFAGEGYNSEGAMIDVVVNKQKIAGENKEKKPGEEKTPRLATTLNEKLQSLNEQFGDVLKEYGHAEARAAEEPRKDKDKPPSKAEVAALGGALSAKYALRFIQVAQEAMDSLPEELRPKRCADDLRTLLAPNAQLGEIRQAATIEKAMAVFANGDPISIESCLWG